MELVSRADWFRFDTEHHTSQYSVWRSPPDGVVENKI